MQVKSYGAKIQDIDEAKGIVRFYANAFDNIDADNDISAKGSFTKTLQENTSRIKWLKDHNPTQLIGVPLLSGSKEDSFGLLTVGQLNLKKEIGRDTFEDYKLNAEHGRTLEHSIGFEIIKSHNEEKSKGMDVRVITEYKLWEISTLSAWGANENTPMVDAKGLDDTLQLLETQLKYNYSDTRLNKVEELIKSLREKPDESTSDIEPIELIKSYYESINK